MHLSVAKWVAVLALLALSAQAEQPRTTTSAYAPGRIFEQTDGWKIYSPTGTRFVSKRNLQGVAPEVAALVALFSGQAVRQTWGWTITGTGQRLEVFEEGSGFVVSTAKENIYVHRSGNCLVLSLGQPGVRRLTPIETFVGSRALKEKQREEKRR